MASYGYWLSEKRWNDRSYVSIMRGDSASAYIITSIFTVSLLILGAALLYGSGTVIDGQAGLVKFSSILSHDLHPAVRWLFLIGFWAASFTSLLGVWNGVSYLYADFVRTVRKSNVANEELSQTKSYRFYIFWLTFPPMLLLMFGKPVALVIIYGALGALFMPFLAITLMVLLNSKDRLPKQDRSKWLSNTVLSLSILLFIALAIIEFTHYF